jgi:hydrogenase maturation protease
VRVIGCGNLDGGDDAIGLSAVRGAAQALRSRPNVDVVEAGMPVRVLELMTGVDAVVLVDAVRTIGERRPPGTVVRVEAGPEGLPAGMRPQLSSHGIGLADAVHLASALGASPRVVLIGVELGATEQGASLSTPVADALPALEAAIEREVDHLLEAPR